MKFKALMSGTFGVVAVNSRLRVLCEAITRLEDLAGIGEKVETETVTIAPEPVVEVTTTIAPADEDKEGFNWRTSESIEALKAYAMEKYGLTIRKQKVDTIRAAIQSYIETQAGE